MANIVNIEDLSERALWFLQPSGVYCNLTSSSTLYGQNTCSPEVAKFNQRLFFVVNHS
jgi:hypothetical protein